MESFAATIGEAIYTLFVESQRVGIRRYEDGGSAEIAQRLTPSVLELLARGCTILAELIEHYEAPGASASASSAADIAFLAHTELRRHQHRLRAHRPASDVQEMVSECGSALRGIQKSLYAVELQLCELERIPRFLPSHLATSLQVRRHYRDLWHFAAMVGDVTADTVRSALRGAGTRISILAGSDVYCLLREDDRFYIRELQLRILEWLREDTDPGAGIRIWQDFALFVEILRQVNLREELVLHDRDVVFAAADELMAQGDEALPAVDKMLRSVLGLDDALDEAILGNFSSKTLLRELRRSAEPFGGLPGDSLSRSVAL